MRGGGLLLAVLLVSLSGCAATLEHPGTHQRATCRSGWALGGGTGIAGGVMAGIALVGNVLYVAEYQKCVGTLKRAGYEEITPAPASNEPEVPSPTGRDPG